MPGMNRGADFGTLLNGLPDRCQRRAVAKQRAKKALRPVEVRRSKPKLGLE